MGLTPPAKTVREVLRSALPGLFILVPVVLLALGGEPVREALRLDRAAVGAGEVWRLGTGHLVHLGTTHALLNVAGLVLVALLVARDLSWQAWGMVTVAGVVAIDAGLWWLNPSLDWYVGLSGLLHAWFAAGIVAALAERRPDGWLLFGLLAGKLLLEQWRGALPSSAAVAGGPVVVDAHLYGAVGGALAAIALIRLAGRRRL